MAKIKAGIFAAKVNAPSGAQPAIVVVAVPEGNKTWQHVVISLGNENGTGVLYAHQFSTKSILSDKIIQVLFPGYYWSDRPVDNLSKSDIVLESKIDEALAMNHNFDSARLNDGDYSNSGSTLDVYIKNNFTVSNEVGDIATASIKRKIAFPKDDIDWDLTWNSPVFTDEEKASMQYPIDLDIAMANADRDCRKIVEKILMTKYYNKNFTCIGLHGNPGGGKTKMVLNDICAINHIPAVAIPCDPMMAIAQLLAQVGPVNQKPLVDSKEVNGLIQALKNQLTLLEQSTQRTAKEDEEIREILAALRNIATISKDCAELVKTPSILMKCLKNNLPLVVFLDEANCSSTQFQNSLAPIISDGIFKDGPEVGHNNGTIKWVLAWNPNTSNTKSFDGKFFDRMSFVQVEDVTSEQRIAYRLRKTIRGMYDTAPDYSKAEAVLSAARAAHPESVDIIDKIDTDIHSYNASRAALEWATQTRINEELHLIVPTFSTGKFCPAYLGDVQLDTEDKAAVAILLIDDLVQKINRELYTETKGKDTKNPDRNSFFYISDRNMDVFTDMIFSYSSVAKAVYRYIFDLIPGGNTVRSGSNSDKSTEDKTPQIIAQAICDKLDGDIVKLHNVLFTEITDADIADATGKLTNAVFASDVWVIAPDDIIDPIDDTTDADLTQVVDDDLGAETDSWLG